MNAQPTLLERWPTALPVELIGPALAQVEIAFCHGNEEEAHAAIRRVFAATRPKPTVTRESPIAELCLPQRILNELDRMGIMFVRDLCDWSMTELTQIPNFGERTARRIRAAVEECGHRLKHGNTMLTGALE
jgi:DNA-directed RNA polymerase alpha subunit